MFSFIPVVLNSNSFLTTLCHSCQFLPILTLILVNINRISWGEEASFRAAKALGVCEDEGEVTQH